MPKCDKTGPMGMGPMTETSAGYCTGFTNQSYANPIGCRFGFNRERGFGRKHYTPASKRHDMISIIQIIKRFLKGMQNCWKISLTM